MADLEQKKKRIFRKVTYRGVDLAQRLDTASEQLMRPDSTEQRVAGPGLRRKRHSLLKRLRKVGKEAPALEKPEVEKSTCGT